MPRPASDPGDVLAQGQTSVGLFSRLGMIFKLRLSGLIRPHQDAQTLVATERFRMLAILRATLESTTDAIIVAGDNFEIIDFNA